MESLVPVKVGGAWGGDLQRGLGGHGGESKLAGERGEAGEGSWSRQDEGDAYEEEEEGEEETTKGNGRDVLEMQKAMRRCGRRCVDAGGDASMGGSRCEAQGTSCCQSKSTT
ncbi:hypothetical protein HYQ46_006713 [Verticillium longisporum]|nr:hypothetical protein HYQ46_006713 [Verticillium longisporum]